MLRRALVVALSCVAGTAGAQFPPNPQQSQFPPHPSTLTPPAQPPIVLSPPPAPQDRVDLKTGARQPAKQCTRDVFSPCADERGRNCTRKETYRCD